MGNKGNILCRGGVSYNLNLNSECTPLVIRYIAPLRNVDCSPYRDYIP